MPEFPITRIPGNPLPSAQTNGADGYTSAMTRRGKRAAPKPAQRQMGKAAKGKRGGKPPEVSVDALKEAQRKGRISKG